MNEAGRRVLVISGTFPPDRMAEGDHVLHLCRGLAEHGLEIEVLTRRGAVGDASLPFRVHALMSAWSWLELRHVVRVAKRFSPDVVFLFYVGSAFDLHPMVTFVPTVLKRLLPKAAFVTQITVPVGSVARYHSLGTRVVRKAVELALGQAVVDYSYGTLLRDSERIIVMAPAHLKAFERNSPQLPAKSILIPAPSLIVMSPPDGRSRTRGRQALGLAEDEFAFAYFGRLYRGKGLETLLKAYQKVRARHSKVRLAIVGGEPQAYRDRFRDDWRLEDVHELSRQLGVEDSVVWTGEFPWDSNLGSTYLRAADAAVLPFDGGVDLNNSSFAAVAVHGLATITTRSPAAEAPFVDGANVLLCPPLDPEAMAAQMERLLADVELRRRLRSGIEVLAKHWFSWEVSIERTIEALNTPRLAA
jgi:glycosyltransferase involved in cell wall biosynthesis